MTLINKGEILHMYQQGFTIRDISGVTGRSMDWIKTIIGALANCDIEKELINEYKNNITDNGTSNSCKRTSRQRNKKSNSKKDKSELQRKNKRTKYKRNGLSIRSQQTQSSRKRVSRKMQTFNKSANKRSIHRNTNKRQSIIDKLKDNADYIE